MKLRPLFSICALGIFAFGAIASFGQDDLSDPLNPQKAPPRIYIGPVAGYNRSMHTGKFASIPNSVNDSPVPCPVFDGGTNNGFYVGGTMEYLLGDPKDAVSSIIGKVVYNSLPASFGIDGLPYKVVNPDTTQPPVTTTVQHISEVTYHTLDLEVLYKLNLFGSSFGIIAGPTFGFSLGKTEQLQQFQLVDPPNAQFAPDPKAEEKHLRYSEDKRTITIRDGELPNAESFRAAIKAGVQYEQPIFGNRFYLIPHIFYNFGITKLTSAENWRVNALQTGVDLRFAL